MPRSVGRVPRRRAIPGLAVNFLTIEGTNCVKRYLRFSQRSPSILPFLVFIFISFLRLRSLHYDLDDFCSEYRIRSNDATFLLQFLVLCLSIVHRSCCYHYRLYIVSRYQRSNISYSTNRVHLKCIAATSQSHIVSWYRTSYAQTNSNETLIVYGEPSFDSSHPSLGFDISRTLVRQYPTLFLCQ